jgi:hypothetical protein
LAVLLEPRAIQIAAGFMLTSAPTSGIIVSRRIFAGDGENSNVSGAAQHDQDDYSGGFHFGIRSSERFDRDHTVDHDERLKITDTAAGVYDVKFVDKSGRTCVVPNIQVKTGAVFTIEEKDLKGCGK